MSYDGKYSLWTVLKIQISFTPLAQFFFLRNNLSLKLHFVPKHPHDPANNDTDGYIVVSIKFVTKTITCQRRRNWIKKKKKNNENTVTTRLILLSGESKKGTANSNFAPFQSETERWQRWFVGKHDRTLCKLKQAGTFHCDFVLMFQSTSCLAKHCYK